MPIGVGETPITCCGWSRSLDLEQAQRQRRVLRGGEYSVRGAVGRAVIHDDHLESSGTPLPLEPRKRLEQNVLAVLGRDDDRELGHPLTSPCPRIGRAGAFLPDTGAKEGRHAS